MSGLDREAPCISIKYASVTVDDQNKAEAWYTKVLGFRVVQDVPLDGEHRWLTVG
jgi:catechol 2,3-dioxygenase-like lactoylglutathione lyase family enzyme